MRIEHKPRYEAMLEAYRQARRGTEPDRYWKALLWILTTPPDLWEKARPYIDLARGNAWLDRMREEVDLTGGERPLLDLAQNLFNGGCLVDVGELANYLDDANWDVAMEAIRIRREGE